jgi:hypothetical protein
VAQQAEHRADRDAGQHQDADGIDPAVPADADDHSGGREHTAQHERGHQAQPGRTQQVVSRQRPGDVEDRDLRDRAQSSEIHGADNIGRIDLKKGRPTSAGRD